MMKSRWSHYSKICRCNSLLALDHGLHVPRHPQVWYQRSYPGSTAPSCSCRTDSKGVISQALTAYW